MGEVAYKSEFPKGLSGVHDVFHVSQLKKCHAEMADIHLRDTVPLEAIARDFGYQARVQYIFSSADRWTDRDSQSDFGGHAKSLCARLWI